MSLMATGSTSVKVSGLATTFVVVSSLRYFGGIHEIENGFNRSLSKRFPFGIYYIVDSDCVTVVAILDLRREPLWIRESLDARK